MPGQNARERSIKEPSGECSVTDEKMDGALLAMTAICISLAGEVAALRADIANTAPGAILDAFVGRLESQLPAALASIEDQAGPDVSASYEAQIEHFAVLCRSVISFFPAPPAGSVSTPQSGLRTRLNAA
jgi:hypothetical protein